MKVKEEIDIMLDIMQCYVDKISFKNNENVIDYFNDLTYNIYVLICSKKLKKDIKFDILKLSSILTKINICLESFKPYKYVNDYTYDVYYLTNLINECKEVIKGGDGM